MPPRLATIDDYRWLYRNDPNYMPDGLKCAREIMLDIVERCPATFLDFGCGRGHLVAWINTKTSGRCAGWDPADWDPPGQPDLTMCPRAHAEYVIACDVLEHVSEPVIDQTLTVLRAMAGCGLLLTIANMSDVHAVAGEAVELHLIQEPSHWWMDRIRQHFPAATITHREINCHRFVLIVEF